MSISAILYIHLPGSKAESILWTLLPTNGQGQAIKHIANADIFFLQHLDAKPFAPSGDIVSVHGKNVQVLLE